MDFSILRITVKPPTTSLNSQYALKARAYSSRGRKQQETLRTTHRTPSEREVHIKLTDLATRVTPLWAESRDVSAGRDTASPQDRNPPPQELCSSSPPPATDAPSPPQAAGGAACPAAPSQRRVRARPRPRGGAGPGSAGGEAAGGAYLGGGGEAPAEGSGGGGTGEAGQHGAAAPVTPTTSSALRLRGTARGKSREIYVPTPIGSLARFPSRLWEVSRDLELTSPLVTARRPLPSNQAGRAGCSGGRRLSRYGGGGALRAPAPLQHPQPAAAVSPAGGAPLPVPAG